MRVEPAEEGSWLLSRDDKLTGHYVPSPVAALLVAAFASGTIANLAEPINSVLSPDTQTELVVEWLLLHGYLVPEDDVEAARITEWLASWAQNGWRAASRYHARTYGYPFEFYEADGNSAEDVRRMVSYNAQQPDLDRARSRLTGATRSYAIPEPHGDFFSMQSCSVVDGTAPTVPLNDGRLKAFLSLLTRPVRTSKMPYPGAADLLRKTSPSGGSRHPTEFVVAVDGVAGIEDGLYQVAAVDGFLDSLDRLEVSPRSLAAALDFEVGAMPWAIVLFNSYFARNRYRYREPRTFRTVHMDVGHLMGTAEYLGRANGWAVRHAQHINGKKIAVDLGIDNYVEAPIAATLIQEA